jgi:hypothetical protein
MPTQSRTSLSTIEQGRLRAGLHHASARNRPCCMIASDKLHRGCWTRDEEEPYMILFPIRQSLILLGLVIDRDRQVVSVGAFCRLKN